MASSRVHRLIEIYYLATPLFFLIDIVFGAPLRVSALENAWLRYAYYAFATVCGVLMGMKPRVAPLLGMLESSVNLFLVLLAVLMPVYGMTEAIMSDEPLTSPLTPIRLVNVALTGTLLVISFHASQARLLSQWWR